jgi:hypothetical protein
MGRSHKPHFSYLPGSGGRFIVHSFPNPAQREGFINYLFINLVCSTGIELKISHFQGRCSDA